ncbi:hypothetical protein GLOTRDRAFT_38729 [Gloeophyllum trabeum ATCC 11539]|uniref:Dipeptidase n=1 Tax=Gloeophyllum trabeum (strain ATCC 11539 / FP-39264 / Madison 617) TaxID=670483 RepID=S7RWE4_GLOTA|nr:uncharacterized protein GLOTRDRAFT_38729 [Gloeophyllum trabeum ATCC 11539]EPQ57639.1 hypothetical protein GLOTRDRAFT_38729 [Gloeophyllum trabeum ATCC 11539]
MSKVRAVVHGLLTVLFVAGLVVFLLLSTNHEWPWKGSLPKDPLKAAQKILEASPVIDGHIDLPELVRMVYANNVSAVDLEHEMPGHVDIPRLRKGRVGGFFWSVYTACPEHAGYDAGEDFLNATWRVRDTLEQIDVAKLLIDKYPNTFQLARSSQDIKDAITEGKIASLLGVEGAHQLGNSIAVLRQYHELGVRYVTLTHMCHNAFADSCGFLEAPEPLHGGLSEIGVALIAEMNRIGVLVDLSHTADATAKQALKLTKAPVIWSHSSSRAIWNVSRNVPDDVLELVGSGENKTDGVVMVNFAPYFVGAEGNATIASVADHVEHIAKIAGKKHVGLGSDYDGIEDVPSGLEDVSKYPQLFAELYKRGWSRYDLAGLSGGNLLRVFEGAEAVARKLQQEGTQPAYDIYKKRTDIGKKREL